MTPAALRSWGGVGRRAAYNRAVGRINFQDHSGQVEMERVAKTAWAGIKASESFICVQTYSGYRGSQMDPSGSTHYLEVSAGDQELCAALMDALGNSRFVIPAMRRDVWIHPDAQVDAALYDFDSMARRYDAWIAECTELYGYKTRKALFKNMKSCTAKCQSRTLYIQPMKKERGDGWSVPENQPDVSVTVGIDRSSEEIGAALRLALARCT